MAGGGLLLLCAVVLVLLLGKERFFPGAENPGENGQPNEQLSETLGGGRKHIYDRNFMELAVSFRRSSIYARPLELEQPEEVARQVARLLGLDEKNILATLLGERSFSWLGRDLSPKKTEEIAELNLKGVYRMDQVYRYYPGGQLGAHVLGFLKDEQGLSGVELYYDSILRRGGIHDPRLVAAGVSRQFAEGGEGASIVLTIDIHLQSILEQRLRGLAAATGARNAMALFMVPDTGEILALANLPAYDPNRYWEYSAEERRNRVVEDVVELGGMVSLFHGAAALARRGGAEKTVGVVATGEDVEAVPPMAVWNRLQEGTSVSAELFDLARVTVDNAVLAGFSDEIGLTAKGEIDLPEALFALRDGAAGQLGGRVAATDSVAERTGAMAPLPELLKKVPLPQGEKNVGPAATPVALLSAFCRLVNGGKVMTPHVLRSLWHGGKVWDVPAREGEREFVVRPHVSQNLLAAMKPWARGPENSVVLESLLQKSPGLVAPVQAPAPVLTVASAAEQDSAQEKPFAGNSILLGMAPVQRPEVAMLVVLEGAAFNGAEYSPLRRLAQEMLPLARTVLGKKASLPSVRELAVREVAYRRKWEKNIAEIEAGPVLPQGSEGVFMPDVSGLSLRKALQALQQYGLKLQIKGAGQVVRQSPPAGAPLKGINQCVLELQAQQ